VIVSLVYQVARKLLVVPAVLLGRDAAKDAELLVLRHRKTFCVSMQDVGTSP
jgi:putative transposase